MISKYKLINNLVVTVEGSYGYSPFPSQEAVSSDFVGVDSTLLFIRYSYDFDCYDTTDWWYIVKDQKEDISAYSSNHRNQIRKGLKSFIYKKVDDDFIVEYGYDIYTSCMSSFGRPTVSRDDYVQSVLADRQSWLKVDYFGVFQDDELIGYAKNLIDDKGSYVFYEQILIKTDFKKLYPNYGLIHTLNEYYLNTAGYRYVSDGSRTLLHPSGIQDFLIKKWGFRKAYCRLHIHYSQKMKMLLPFISTANRYSGGFLSKKMNKVRALLLQHSLMQNVNK